MTITEDRAQKIATYIRKVVDSAPPFTPEQRDMLAALLRPDTNPR